MFVRAQSNLTLCNPMDLCPWNFPGKDTKVGYHFLLQKIFLTQGSNHLPTLPWPCLAPLGIRIASGPPSAPSGLARASDMPSPDEAGKAICGG